MRNTPRLARSSLIFIGLAVLYLLLCFILPISGKTLHQYHFSESEYRCLLFIVRLPILAVWGLAFYSYRCLHHYVYRITDTPEGKHFRLIEKGVSWIAWGWLVPAIVSALLVSLGTWHHVFTMWSAIISDYAYVTVSLMAFGLISAGAYKLATESGIHLTLRSLRMLVGALVALGVLFCYLMSVRLRGDLSNSYNAYYLPNSLVWITLVIPYLYAWFIGLFAALELVLISRHTQGIIYRQALQSLAFGLVAIIGSLCAMQYFRSLIPRTGSIAVGGTLITAYAIYALSAVGAILLILGAKRLKRIEDI